MKFIFIMAFLIVLAGGAALFLGSGGPDHHGNAFKGLPPVTATELATKPEDHLKIPHSITGVIDRQCPATGCWFYIKDASGKEVKIELGDTTPHLPQRTGKQATVEGQLIKFGDGYEFIGNAVEFKK